MKDGSHKNDNLRGFVCGGCKEVLLRRLLKFDWAKMHSNVNETPRYKMFYKFIAMWNMIIIRILLVCSIMKQNTVDLGLS